MTCRIIVLGAVALISSWSLASGQLVSNGHFDTDTTGWSGFPEGTLEWDPRDVADSPSSGSALVTNEGTGSGNATGPSQCVSSIQEGERYLLGSSVYFESGQGQTGWTRLLIRWYSDFCGGNQLALNTTPNASSPDVWSTTSKIFDAPASSVEAWVRLDVWKVEAGGSLRAYFDDVAFFEVVFDDGFELGDTHAWSEAIGAK